MFLWILLSAFLVSVALTIFYFATRSKSAPKHRKPVARRRRGVRVPDDLSEALDAYINDLPGKV